MRYQLLLIAALLPASGRAQSSVPAPEHRWIVEQFFFANAWPKKADYYTREMSTAYAAVETMGEARAPARRGTLRMIQESSSQVVYSVQVGDAVRVQDWYAYVVRDGSAWRLAAVRTLALPQLFFMALDSLVATKPLPDSLTGLLESMRLTASSDSALKEFFYSRQDQLQAIADAFARETVRSVAAAPEGLEAPTASLRSLAQRLASLHLRGAWRDPEVAGCVFVEIGGMLDNEVGFMQCASEARVPEITPGRFILIERLTGGWYLYKTT